jgi:chloramphenicol O-acetyltransferase
MAGLARAAVPAAAPSIKVRRLIKNVGLDMAKTFFQAKMKLHVLNYGRRAEWQGQITLALQFACNHASKKDQFFSETQHHDF